MNNPSFFKFHFGRVKTVEENIGDYARFTITNTQENTIA